MYTWCPQSSEEGVSCPGTVVTDGWDLLWVLCVEPGRAAGALTAKLSAWENGSWLAGSWVIMVDKAKS